jgi:hypothetical protein
MVVAQHLATHIAPRRRHALGCPAALGDRSQGWSSALILRSDRRSPVLGDALRSRLDISTASVRAFTSSGSFSRSARSEVTRKRMYLETMERVLGGTDKIILDSRSGQGVVPFLSIINDIRHDKGLPPVG